MKQDIVIIGAGGHAKVIADILERAGETRILGFVDTHQPKGREVFGYRILGTEKEVIGTGAAAAGIVAIGDNATRRRVVARVLGLCPTFHFVSAVHPSAILGRGVTIGCGTALMANSVINPDSRVGEHCVINTAASVDHDCQLGDFTTVGPGARLGGAVKLGTGSAVWMGAVVFPGIEIGDYTLVGGGSTVNRPLPSQVLAHGSPARIVRERGPEDRCL